jgi:protein gp37
MAENSGIEWTHHTFNPWIGCTKVSPACDHCYAEAWDNRFNGERWGPHAARTRTKTWGNPVKWNRKAEAEGDRYRVFCASLADVFDNHKSIDPSWRRELWKLIEDTPNLDWLLLTKRPQNIVKFAPERWFLNGIPENIWMGTTVENQEEADRRLPHLVQIPAKVRFLSCEPIVGPVMIRAWLNKLDWVITGGESGNHYRPAQADWFRDLRDQCADWNTPFLFKQWEGRNQKEIKAKGRELDGVIHDGYPTVTQ